MTFDPYEVTAAVIVGVSVLTQGYMIAVGVRLVLKSATPVPRRRQTAIFLAPLLYLGYLYLVSKGVKPAIVSLTDGVNASLAERESLIRTALAAGIYVCVASTLDYLAHARPKELRP